MTEKTPPPGAPPRLFLIIRDTGERHLLDAEPAEGIEAWAKGQEITVLEYPYARVLHDTRAKKG